MLEKQFLETIFEGSNLKKGLIQKFTEGIILKSVGNLAIIENLSEKEKELIKNLESKHSNYKVLHVIQNYYILGGTDEVEMTSYIMVNTGDEVEFEWELDIFREQGILNAFVVNKEWDAEEFGSIAVKVNELTGGMNRLG